MAQTVRDLVTNSLRTINAIESGEPATAEEAEDARTSLNEMLEIWNLESLMVFTMPREIQTLTAGKSEYTLGLGGDWNIARPVRLDSAAFLDTASGTETRLWILTNLEYRNWRTKSTPGTWQTWLYLDYDYPLINATVYPVPSINNQIILYPWHQLSQVPSLDTSIDLPPGYAAALRYNLAVWIGPEYSVQVNAGILRLAAETKRRIKVVNTPREVRTIDPVLTSPYPNRFDWRAGRF